MIGFDVHVRLGNIKGKITNAVKKGQFALDNQVLKDSNFYIPKDTGMLEGSGISASDLGNGKVAWNTPYARKLYYNPQYNFSKDVNPNARGLWFEQAKATKLQYWLKITKKAIKNNL